MPDDSRFVFFAAHGHRYKRSGLALYCGGNVPHKALNNYAFRTWN